MSGHQGEHAILGGHQIVLVARAGPQEHAEFDAHVDGGGSRSIRGDQKATGW